MVSHQEGDEARMPSENVTHSQQELKDEGEVRAPPIRFFGRRVFYFLQILSYHTDVTLHILNDDYSL